MSDLFDSLKKNKERTTGKKNVRALSPVKFPFSDDEDSDEVVLKKPTKPVKNSKAKTSPQTKQLLKLMRKCMVRLPKDKDGRLLQRIHAEWRKQRKNKTKNNTIKKNNNINNKKNNNINFKKDKYPIVKVKNLSKSPVKQTKTPESSKKSKSSSSPTENKKTTPAKVYVKFPLSTPNSNRKKKTYAKTPLKKKAQKPKPRGYDIAVKRLNATPALVREFGKRFFMCFVDIQNDDLVQLQNNPKIKSPPKKRKLNSSVRFNDTVEIFGSSESEDEDQFKDPMPVSLITAMNGGFDATSTPSPKQRGRPKSTASLEKEKKKPILTPAAKKNYRLADEKRGNISNEAEEEEDDDAEYIVPTEISPPKKQATPPRLNANKSPSLEKENSLLMPSEPITEPASEPEPEAEPVLEQTHVETTIEEQESMEVDKVPEEEQNEVTEREEEPKVAEEPVIAADEEKNDFENDEDSQGQNIVQDFISRTVQDLSHDDSDDIQDDEELVDDKINSSPIPNPDLDLDLNNDEIDKLPQSNTIQRLYQSIRDKVLGDSETNQSMETDNV
ncbi:hypothetical protein ACFFRR_001511 [Megaselia abdita]